MKFEDRQRQYRSLKDKNPAWSVLARDGAPLILAFLGDLFHEAAEVPIESARARLVPVLERNGNQDPAVHARLYINTWIDDGLLREQDQKLTMTAATQNALQFVEALGGRDMTVTASHLETVNEEMRRVLVTLSPDVEEQQRFIDEQIRNLESAKQRLLDGKTPERTPAQKREHVRHLFSLASGLTQDFRFLEDEMRLHEIAIHQRILDEHETRGSVLGGVLDAEDLMRQSPAGQAFEGFFALLGDDDRVTQFRSQVKRLFSLGASEYLSPDEARYLQRLDNELLEQSARVVSRRRGAIESLKAYMLSGAQEEHREIDRVLKRSFQKLGRIRELAPAGWRGWRSASDLSLGTGKYLLKSPTRISITYLSEQTDFGEIIERPVSRSLSADALSKLSGFNLKKLAERTRQTLLTMGSKTIGELAHLQPITGGIEEVLGLMRLARATHGIPLQDTEIIFVTDARRGLLRVEIPSVVLRPDDFPEDLADIDA